MSYRITYVVPGESLFYERDPHLVRVDGPGAPRQQTVDTDGQMIIYVDVVPASEPPEPTVKYAVVPLRTDTIRIIRHDLHATSNTRAIKAVLIRTMQLYIPLAIASTSLRGLYDKQANRCN